MTRAGTESIPIRPATEQDYASILLVWRESGLRVSEDGRDGPAAFRDQLARFPGLYLVAADAERVIGVVLGTHDGRKGWINRLAVLPQHRRSGIGSRLVQACDRAIRELGIEIVTALVEPRNQASCRLFEKLGFRTDVPVTYFRKVGRPGA